MGCCVSTDASHISKSESNRKRGSKSPPPSHPLQDEEAVKEVLSETPTIPKRPSPAFVLTETPLIKTAPLLTPGLSKSRLDEKKPRNGVVLQKPCVAFRNEEVSVEVSEICSTVSESTSVSTSVAEKKDSYCSENDVATGRKNRSPARVGNQSYPGEYKRDRSAGKSLYRRSEPSPGRARIGSGRKESNDEISVRRSRSPMMRVESGSVKPSAGRIQRSRKTGKSPSRVGTEKVRKLEEETEEDNGEQQWPMTSHELLENPLVSLECFIFL